MSEENKPPSFAETIKAAMKNKLKVPTSKTAQVQKAKFHSQVSMNKPGKKASGRGG